MIRIWEIVAGVYAILIEIPFRLVAYTIGAAMRGAKDGFYQGWQV